MSIEAMQVALGALDWAADHITPEKPINCDCPVCVASDALRLAIEQAERQEPMAWEDVLGAIAQGWTHPENAQKPMDVQLAVAIAKEIQDMYTAPPQRQPLTRKEVLKIIDSEPANMTTGLPMFYRDQVSIIARAIERAHGIGGGE
jgi:hypothetical protein